MSTRPTPTPGTATRHKEIVARAAALESLEARVAALKQFTVDYPGSAERTSALELLTAARAALADELMKAGNTAAALTAFQAAVEDAPNPIPQKLFSDVVVKIPSALFWSGNRETAYEAARSIERKIAENAEQLGRLAEFYIEVENGDEALRVAREAVRIAPASSAAYNTLGLAHRLNFSLDESAVAYARALELDPASDSAKRSLADLKRAQGRTEEALALYQELLQKEEALPARTGLVLTLFDAGKREEAETELARALEKNPNNLILLAGAAYWYATIGEGARAVELAQDAIAKEPRYIWSHIALARGFVSQRRPLDAEKALLRARQYGNFPTLDYEIAYARSMAGFYQEAAEELRKTFAVKDGMIHARLGGRTLRTEDTFEKLLAPERRASIFEPGGRIDPARDAQLKALLEIEQAVSSSEVDETKLGAHVDAFIEGDDAMKLHRQLYAADTLLKKQVALPKVLELIKKGLDNTEAALDVAEPSAAVMASELYESRTIAFARGEIIQVPPIPRQTLSAILRGRLEELAGWALYHQNDREAAVIRLRRAISVLPEKSAWWRSSTWRLGAALESTGQDAEALDSYIKSYSSDRPNIAKYMVVETLYKKINGSTDGLESKIGPNPLQIKTAKEPEAESPPVEVVQKVADPVLEPKPISTPAPSPVQPRVIRPQAPKAPPSIVPIARSEKASEADPATVQAQTEVKRATPIDGQLAENSSDAAVKDVAGVTDPPTSSEVNDQTDITQAPSEKAVTEPPTSSEVNDQTDITPAPSEKAVTEPAMVDAASITEPEVEGIVVQPDNSSGAPSPSESPTSVPPVTKTVEPPTAQHEVPDPGAIQNEIPPTAPPDVVSSNEVRADEAPAAENPSDTSNRPAEPDATNEQSKPKPLFEPIIITIPKSEPITIKSAVTPSGDAEGAKTPSSSDKVPIQSGLDRPRITDDEPMSVDPSAACKIDLSQDDLSILNDGGSVGILVGLEGGDVKTLDAKSSSPKDVEIVLEPEIAGVSGRAFYVIKSISTNTGIYSVSFEAPCGKRHINVTVR